MRQRRGFALVIVLWTVALLALLATHLLAAGRTEAQVAGNLKSSAAAVAAADGAIQAALFHVLADGAAHWAPPTNRRVPIPGGAAEVQVLPETGKINPNSADAPTLAALLTEAGADPQAAASIAAAIVDWRSPGQRPSPGGAKAPQYLAAGRDYGPPGGPFRNLREIGLVLGMTPELLAAISPSLSLYWDGDPDPAVADPLVLRTLQRLANGDTPDATGPQDDLVVVVRADAAVGTARAERQAVLRLGFAARGRPWQVLAWGSVE